VEKSARGISREEIQPQWQDAKGRGAGGAFRRQAPYPRLYDIIAAVPGVALHGFEPTLMGIER
jgi:hypothetical protein